MHDLLNKKFRGERINVQNNMKCIDGPDDLDGERGVDLELSDQPLQHANLQASLTLLLVPVKRENYPVKTG